MRYFKKNLAFIFGFTIIILIVFLVFESETATAGSYDGQDIAEAILADPSVLIDSSYEDKDESGTRQKIILESLGIMEPTNGINFALFSTGIAGQVPVTTDGVCPHGDERGTVFRNKFGKPRDFAILTMSLRVPPFMHYLYYDFQFFSAEYPEYLRTKYNDKFSVTVDSPSMGVSTFVCDVNSGNFVLDSDHLDGTGFNIFAESGDPADIDLVNMTPRHPGEDAGATARITRGGETHPVTPNEIVIITFEIVDGGDNQVDSAVFLDNVVFSGEAKSVIQAKKTVEDLNGGGWESGDTVEYTVLISNTGNIDQHDCENDNEFEDTLPSEITYVNNSATSNIGTVEYEEANTKIIWNGDIPMDTSVVITFQATINEGLANGTIVSNRGLVNWDRDGDGIHDSEEYTIQDKDHNETIFVVQAYAPPETVIEDFSDDTTGGNATELYMLHPWFETKCDETPMGGNFEVAGVYHYSTEKSFKTRIRQMDGSHYWNYLLKNLDSEIQWWETWFTCGNGSDAYDLYLDFENEAGQIMVRLKFEYFHTGITEPTEWILRLFYWSPSYNDWEQILSNYSGGYLFNDWYKLRIEKNQEGDLVYTLEMADDDYNFTITDDPLPASFTDLKKVEFYSNLNPPACPIFFWDEHKLGLVEK
jgi:uncharacterized repeat protein (TIGR01451 family)